MNKNNALSPLTHLVENHPVRTVEVEGHTLVSANDSMTALGYPNARNAWYDLKPTVVKYSGEDVRSYPTWVKGRVYDMDYLNLKQFITLCLKSTKERAVPFFQWGVSVLEKEIVSIATQGYDNNQIKAFKDKTLEELTEDEIRDALILLDSRNFSRWKWEASYTDPLRPALPNGERTRRFDAIAKFGRVIRILELKAKPITSVEVAEILDDRGYLEVAASHYPNKCIDVVLVAPSISESGRRALERLGAESEYKEFTVAGFTYRAKIRFVSVQEFATSISTRALNDCPRTAKWILMKEITKYAPLFPAKYLFACQQLFKASNVIEPA